MSDAISFLLILPALLLGVVVLDAAGTLGTARYRADTYAEAAASEAADTLSGTVLADSNPENHVRWDELEDTVQQAGIAATAGVCDQAEDSGYEASLWPLPGDSEDPPEVAVVVSCPVKLGPLLHTKRVLAYSGEAVR